MISDMIKMIQHVADVEPEKAGKSGENSLKGALTKIHFLCLFTNKGGSGGWIGLDRMDGSLG